MKKAARIPMAAFINSENELIIDLCIYPYF